MGHEEVLPEGAYSFVCIDAGEKTSQSGNPMIELRLLVKGPNGNSELRIFDHLVFAPRAYWKIDMFRVATGETLVPGQAVRFEAEDCIDREGKVWLKVETFEGRSRNKVEKYLDPKGGESSAGQRRLKLRRRRLLRRRSSPWRRNSRRRVRDGE